MRKILIFVLSLICFNVNAQELLREGGYKTSGATSGQTLKWNGTTWLPGIDLDGPYTGSGTVPNNTNATLTDDFTITGADATGTQSPKFRVVATGTDPGVQVWKVGNDSLQLSFISGEPTLEAIGTSGNDFWISAVGNDIRLGINSTGVFTHTTKNVLGGYLALPFIETNASITVTEAQSEILVTGTSGVITLTFDNTSNLLGSAAKTIKVRNQGSHNVTLSRGSQSWEWIDMVGSATASNQTLAAGETATMLWYDGGVTDYYLLQKIPATFSGTSTDLAVTGTSSPLTLTSSTGTDVTFTAGSGVTLSGSASNITINATGSGDILNGGNTTGSAVTIGTNDDNALNLETNGVSRLNISSAGASGGTVTTTAQVPFTNSTVDVVINQANSNGGVHAPFGVAYLLQGESSTTNNRDMARLGAIWTTATDASREAKLTFQLGNNAGALAEVANINVSGDNLGQLSVGSSTPVTISPTAITPSTDFLLSSNTSILEVGGTSGPVKITSSGTNNTIQLTPSSASGYVEVGQSSPSTITSGTKYNMYFPQGFTASSGTGVFNNLVMDGTINQSGTASGALIGLNINHAITSAIDYTGLQIGSNGANVRGIYQTGNTATNNFVGKSFFGASTTPTAMLHLGQGTSSLSSLKFTSGTTLTTPEAGAVEWNGTNLFVTQTSGPTRKTIAYTTDITDASATNEGSLTVNAGSGSTSVISSNTSGSTDVTITAGTGIGISESGNNITLTNTGIVTEVDGSTTNELQTVANTSDGTSHTVTLSNSGGSVQLVEGSGITLTTTGTSGAGVVTIASTAGGSGDITNGGNSTGSAVTIGTNDNNALNLETNNVTRFSIESGASTGGAITATNITANTVTNQDVLTLRTNSSGSAGAGFGAGILFKGETSSIDNTDMGRLRMVYDAVGGSEQVGFAIDLNSLGTVAQAAKFDRFGTLSTGRSTPTQYGGATVGIIPASDLLINTTTAHNTYVGGGTGRVRIKSSGTGTYGIEMGVTDPSSGGWVAIGVDDGSTLTSTSTTTADKPILELKHGFAAASGGNRPIGLLISNALDQTGSAFGVMTGIKINPTLTNVANTYRAIDIVPNHSSAKGIYQSGTSTTNNFVGKTYFGSTSSPTALVQVGAGTTTVAPIILTSGTNLTTPVAGAIEWDGTNLFATQTTGPTRKTVAYTTDVAGQTVITPSQITSDQNDWNPTSLSTATLIRINGDASFRSLTGITAPTTDKTIKILNVGSNSLAFLKDHTSSTAANRFDMLKDEILLPGETMEIYYDLTASRWKLMQHVKTSVGRRVRRWQYVPSATSTSPEYHFTWSAGSGAAAALTAPASTNDVRGANLVLGTGTTTTGAAYLSNKSLSAYVNGAAATESYLGMTIYIPTASDATNTYAVEAGLKTSATIGTSVNGVFFRYTHSENSGNWRIVSTVSGTPSTTNTSVAGVPGTTQTLELFKRPNGTVVFYIDGVAQGSISYSGTIDLQPVVLMTKSAGTTNRTFETSFMEIENYNK